MQAGSQSHSSLTTPERFDLAVELFRTLLDSTRVRLLRALLDGERPVNELAEAAGKALAGVSQHLAKLRMARLAGTRRHANQIFYRLENTHVRQLVEDAIYHAEHTSSGIPEHHRGAGQLSELRSADQ